MSGELESNPAAKGLTHTPKSAQIVPKTTLKVGQHPKGHCLKEFPQRYLPALTETRKHACSRSTISLKDSLVLYRDAGMYCEEHLFYLQKLRCHVVNACVFTWGKCVLWKMMAKKRSIYFIVPFSDV